MPSWFIDIAFLEAAGIILVVTGCFVAGVISGFMEIAEAEKADRRRAVKERHAQMFTEMKRSVERSDQMLRCEQMLAEAESGSMSLPTHEADELAPWLTANNECDLLRCCSDSVTESATFYADNVGYYRIATYWDGTQVFEHPPHGTTEKEVGYAAFQQGSERCVCQHNCSRD